MSDTHFAHTVKRGLLGLAAAGLLALGGYALLAKSGEEPSRAGQTPAGARSMPVLAAVTDTFERVKRQGKGELDFSVVADPDGV